MAIILPSTITSSDPSWVTGFARSQSEALNQSLWQGLKGAWLPALGATGGQVNDISGFNNHGVASGTPQWELFFLGGYALDFVSASSEDLQTPPIDLTGTDKATLSFWLYWDAFANDDKMALEFSTNAASITTGFAVLPNASGAGSQFQIFHNGDVGFYSAEFARPSAAVWHHYVILFDKGSATEIPIVYLDGVSLSLNHALTSNNTNNYGNNQLNMMSRNSVSLFADGKLAFVQLYDRLFSSSEAMLLFHDPFALVRRRVELIQAFPPTAVGHAGPLVNGPILKSKVGGGLVAA